MTDLDTTLRDAGVTYRQFDHWCTKGYIAGLYDSQHPGSGFNRDLDTRQIKQVRLMGQLVTAGMRPDAAANVALRIIAGETPRLGDFALVPIHQVTREDE